MNSVEEFLAYSIKLEEEAVLRFDQLADAMASVGNKEVGMLFRRLAGYSRLHLSDARARAGFRDIPTIVPGSFHWPDIESPETAAIWATDPQIGRGQALEIALDAERAGLEYYTSIVETTTDPEILMLAREFAKEESQHVAELEKWVALHAAGKPLPIDH
ncbi:ferritin-like domain-containing protein [Ferrovum myxofaciens]|uniref:Ferritin family protein n=1 Tax=Ferrovum myxofaciens TaxID=416213 RepID=A0A9E6SYM3_9PROT|nr:ferritin family protein [Ferrovum myxofaciens]MBW8029332.1 rubrerythrin [Ferrovum sp.]MBU6994398.1 ferritin family protein [Ferrovum myxofaciens]NDU89568.1 ferritin family protein [Ferrovum sp.]QKE38291.1 MAG: ferritin family protein [Ferrovum myxofaciens]QKE40844.1 MAG: ferritin family protein [Ferrovum myxofaciens]